MFDSYEAEPRGFSPSLFVVQVVVAPLAGLIMGGVTYLLIEELFRVKFNTLLGYVVFSVQGFIVGYKLQAALPRAIESGGRWVWILPSLVLMWGLTVELARGPNSQVADFFALPPSGTGGLLMLLFTLPLVASCFYSVGVVAASRPPRRGPWDTRLRRLIFRDSGNGEQAETPEAPSAEK